MIADMIRPSWEALHAAGHRLPDDWGPEVLQRCWLDAFKGVPESDLTAAVVVWMDKIRSWARRDPESAALLGSSPPWPWPWAIAECLPPGALRATPADVWSWHPPTGSLCSPLAWHVIDLQEKLRAAHPACYVAIPVRDDELRAAREARYRSDWPLSPESAGVELDPTRDCGIHCGGAGGVPVSNEDWYQIWLDAHEKANRPNPQVDAATRRRLLSRLGIGPGDLQTTGTE